MFLKEQNSITVGDFLENRKGNRIVQVCFVFDFIPFFLENLRLRIPERALIHSAWDQVLLKTLMF